MNVLCQHYFQCPTSALNSNYHAVKCSILIRIASVQQDVCFPVSFPVQYPASCPASWIMQHAIPFTVQGSRSLEIIILSNVQHSHQLEDCVHPFPSPFQFPSNIQLPCFPASCIRVMSSQHHAFESCRIFSVQLLSSVPGRTIPYRTISRAQCVQCVQSNIRPESSM